jgi:hypothetical protein
MNKHAISTLVLITFVLFSAGCAAPREDLAQASIAPDSGSPAAEDPASGYGDEAPLPLTDPENMRFFTSVFAQKLGLDPEKTSLEVISQEEDHLMAVIRSGDDETDFGMAALGRVDGMISILYHKTGQFPCRDLEADGFPESMMNGCDDGNAGNDPAPVSE